MKNLNIKMENNNREFRRQKLEYRIRTQPVKKIEPQRTQRTQSILFLSQRPKAKGKKLFLTTNHTNATNFLCRQLSAFDVILLFKF
jgi:hypothetical protein